MPGPSCHLERNLNDGMSFLIGQTGKGRKADKAPGWPSTGTQTLSHTVEECGSPTFLGSNPGTKKPSKTMCPGTAGDNIPPCTAVSGIEPSTQRLSVFVSEDGAQRCEN